MNKKFLILLTATAAAAIVLGSAPAAAQTAKAKSSTSADAKFAMDAAKGGLMEVEMGKVAADHGSTPDVKRFGQRMVTDHTRANDELKGIASQKGISLPTSLDAAGQAKIDKMSKMSGAAFDKAYMDDMVKDHKKDVAQFRKEANGGKDADIKGFAGKTLPTLEEHLKMAQDTAAKVAGKSAADKAGKPMSTSAAKSSGSSQ